MSVNYEPRRAKQQVNPAHYIAHAVIALLALTFLVIGIVLAAQPAGAEDTAGWIKSWESPWVKSWESPWEKSW